MNPKLEENISNDPFAKMMAHWMLDVDPSKQVDGDEFAFKSTNGYVGLNCEVRHVLPGSYIVKAMINGERYNALCSPCVFRRNSDFHSIKRPYYYDYGYVYAWLTLNEEEQKKQPIYSSLRDELQRIHPEAFRDLESRLKAVRPYIDKVKELEDTLDFCEDVSAKLCEQLEKERENPDLEKIYCIMAMKYMNSTRKKNSKKRECVKEALLDLKKVCKLDDIPEEILNSLDSFDDENITPQIINNHFDSGSQNIHHLDNQNIEK